MEYSLCLYFLCHAVTGLLGCQQLDLTDKPESHKSLTCTYAYLEGQTDTGSGGSKLGLQ